MKKISFLAVMALVFTFTLSSCEMDSLDKANKDSAKEINTISLDLNKTALGEESRLTPVELEFVGVQHNVQLNKIYNLLNENKPITNYDAAMVFAKDYMIQDYMESNFSTDKAKNDFKKTVDKIIETKGFDGTTNLYPEEGIAYAINQKEKDYLDNLYQIIFNSESSNVRATLDNISSLENNISMDKELDNQQLSLLFSATNTAKYSLQYWHSNFGKWYKLNPNNPPLKTDGFWGDLWDDVKYTVAADAGGAVYGAGQAWWLNAAGPEGTAAYGAYIIGSGCLASAAERTVEVVAGT